MIFWLDNHLPPAIAPWIEATYNLVATPLRDLGFASAKDIDIFHAARVAGGVVMVTKDNDFSELVTRLGTPPQVLWLTFGNTSNVRLRDVFTRELAAAIKLLETGEPLVEICDS